jgi:hypothetical protein
MCSPYYRGAYIEPVASAVAGSVLIALAPSRPDRHRHRRGKIGSPISIVAESLMALPVEVLAAGPFPRPPEAALSAPAAVPVGVALL